MIESWYETIEKKGYIDAIYTDFAKAFDSVPHLRLIRKVEWYGIKGKLLSWIKSFLTSRRQRVNGQMSRWSEVKSGVPQGSVLGPILFLIYIYINDMPIVVKNTRKLFADDAKVFGDVSKEGINIQNDIDNLHSWSETW